MPLDDQVWREDVEELNDIAKDSAKVLTEYIRRMTYQRAPGELIMKLARARDLCAEVSDELAPLITCFPVSK